MRKLLVVMFVFALSLGLYAKDASKAKSSAAGASGPKMATLTGCLSGPNDEGAYLLKKSSTSKHGVEVGGSGDLAQHVGHKVKLTGEWAKSGSEIGETEKSGEKGEKAEKAEKEKHFKVDKIDMVSETCSSKKATSTTAKSSKPKS